MYHICGRKLVGPRMWNVSHMWKEASWAQDVEGKNWKRKLAKKKNCIYQMEMKLVFGKKVQCKERI